MVVSDGAGLTGGAERVAIATALGLADRGLRVGFFAGEGELAPDLIAHPGIEATTLGFTDAYHAGSKAELLRRFFYNREAGTRFAEFLTGFDPVETVVHVHAFRRVLSASVVRAARRLGFRQVMTLHDFGIADPNTGFYDFTRERICPLRPMSLACWRTQCTRTGRKGKAVQMVRHTVNGPLLHVWDSFGAFVHVSPFSAEILSSYVPEGASQTVVDNPVSVPRGPRVESERNREFLFVGRMTPEKGGVLLARAARAAGVPVVFVGDGPEAEAIRAANPDARLAGWLSSDEVQARIAGARAVVFPSQWYETAGLGALEALARGVPVIVADQCAAAAYVADGNTGRHFRTGDEASLVAALRQHAETDIAPMARAAYDRYWSDPFTLDRYLDRLFVLYKDYFEERSDQLGSTSPLA